MKPSMWTISVLAIYYLGGIEGGCDLSNVPSIASDCPVSQGWHQSQCSAAGECKCSDDKEPRPGGAAGCQLRVKTKLGEGGDCSDQTTECDPSISGLTCSTTNYECKCEDGYEVRTEKNKKECQPKEGQTGPGAPGSPDNSSGAGPIHIGRIYAVLVAILGSSTC